MNRHFKTIGFALAAFALLLITFPGCEPAGNSNDGKDPQDTIPITNVQTADEECPALQSGQFCIAGFDFLKVGDSLIWNNNIVPSVEPLAMKDTVFEDHVEMGETIDTTAWFVKMLQYPDGPVYLEQDFENPHLMGRIRIETASYSHPSGMKVGSSVKELKAKFNEIIPQPFPQYDVMDLVVPYSGKRMVYQVPLGSYYSADKEEYSMDDIPEDLKVVRVVIM